MSRLQRIYHAYLQTDDWKQKRAAKLAEEPACERCGSRRALQVHHVNYREWFNVTTADLETLCRGCHELHHATARAMEPEARAERLAKEEKTARQEAPCPQRSIPDLRVDQGETGAVW